MTNPVGRSQDHAEQLLERLIADREFGAALELLEAREESRPLTSAELVAKSRVLQLLEPADESNLAKAERALASALELDSCYLPAVLELAWFSHAVKDDSAAALVEFERAIDIAWDCVEEAVRGKAACLEELVSTDAAERFVKLLGAKPVSKD